MDQVLNKILEIEYPFSEKIFGVFQELSAKGKLIAISKGIQKKAIKDPVPTLEGLKHFQYEDVLQKLIYQLYHVMPVTRGVKGMGLIYYLNFCYSI
jgi:hypothetical protein